MKGIIWIFAIINLASLLSLALSKPADVQGNPMDPALGQGVRTSGRRAVLQLVGPEFVVQCESPPGITADQVCDCTVRKECPVPVKSTIGVNGDTYDIVGADIEVACKNRIISFTYCRSKLANAEVLTR